MDKTKEIIAELKRSYAIELETLQNYLAHSVNLEGAEAELIRKSLEEEINLKLKHARRLAKRINVLGGRLPGSLELPRNQKSIAAAVDHTDVMAVVRESLARMKLRSNSTKKSSASRKAQDYVTQDMVIDLLSDERELRRVFLSFLPQTA